MGVIVSHAVTAHLRAATHHGLVEAPKPRAWAHDRAGWARRPSGGR